MQKINFFSKKVLICTVAFAVCLMSISLPAVSNNYTNLGAANNYSSTGNISANNSLVEVNRIKAIWNGTCREAVYLLINVAGALLGGDYAIEQAQQIKVEKNMKMKELN